MNTMDIERALAQGQQIPPDVPQITPEAIQQGIAASQQQQPQIPTGEQAMNAAALEGMAKDNAQYQAAQQEALTQQALQQNIQALSNLFASYNKSSDDVYDDTYSQLIRAGVYGDAAHRIASREASKYSANRVANLQTLMNWNGVTQDGYLTNDGMYYLTQMQNEDPAVASLYSQGYANMPKVAYDRQWKLAEGDHNAARQYQYREQGADADIERRKNYYNWQKDQEMQALAWRADNASKARMAQAYQEAIGLGKSPEEAQRYAESQGQIEFWSVLGGYGGGRGSNNNNRNTGGNRSGGRNGNNGTAGSMEAWKALERALKEFNGAQAELAPGMTNPNAALYQNALYNYFGGIDPSNPQNYSMWKDFYMKTKGMSSEDFDAMVQNMMEQSKHQEETIDKNSRLEVNGSHNEEDDEPVTETETSANEKTEKEDTPSDNNPEPKESYDPSLANSVVAKINGMNDVDDYGNERDEELTNSVYDPLMAEAWRRWFGN